MGLQELVYVLVFSTIVMSSFLYERRLPESVKTCFLNAKDKPVDTGLAERACVMAYFEEISQPRNLTESDIGFFQRRMDSGFGFFPPKTGFRKRRDIRTLTENERERLFSVITAMYWDGTLHRFGRLHGQTKKKVHKGAAFLPWHRLFILDFEEEMRRRDAHVFLPYWDYTMDNNITRPSDSVVWSDCFFGNGAGNVIAGPFKNWYGGHSIQLRRDYAKSGQCPPRLINKVDINGILQKCYFKEITTGSGPYFENHCNIEMLHDGVHDWVGGDMDELPFSAFDPVFYMHHAFIDYIWEKFREHQIERCNVDPETDWRPMHDLCQTGREAMEPFDTMFGYTHLRNIDGCWKNWTELFFNYDDQPSCPDCGNSRYLYCDKKADPRYPDGICLTRTKEACGSSKFQNENEIYPDSQSNSFTYPSFHTSDLVKGLPGDGRHRDLSFEMSNTILQAETAKGISDQQSNWNAKENESLMVTFLAIDEERRTDVMESNSVAYTSNISCIIVSMVTGLVFTVSSNVLDYTFTLTTERTVFKH